MRYEDSPTICRTARTPVINRLFQLRNNLLSPCYPIMYMGENRCLYCQNHIPLCGKEENYSICTRLVHWVIAVCFKRTAARRGLDSKMANPQEKLTTGLRKRPWNDSSVIREAATGFIVNRVWFPTLERAERYLLLRDLGPDEVHVFLEREAREAAAEADAQKEAQRRTNWGPLVIQESDSWVYFVQPEDGGPIKIGKANSPVNRKAALESGMWFRLRFLGVTPGSYEFEHELHLRFSRHRIRYEWFQDVPEIRAAIAFLCEPFRSEIPHDLRPPRAAE